MKQVNIMNDFKQFIMVKESFYLYNKEDYIGFL